MKFTVDGKAYEVEAGNDSVLVDGTAYKIKREANGNLVTVLVNGKPYKVDLAAGPGSAVVDGRSYQVTLEGMTNGSGRATRASAKAKAPASGGIKSLMPGKVISVRVRATDRVAAGDVLVILEAMKMENEIRSPFAGVVTAVPVSPGSNVDKGETLVVVEEDAGKPS